MFNCRKLYPQNVRFGQHLIDIEKTATTYFNVSGDETAIKFANAVCTRFYTSEIGLEELDIFDMKMRAVFNANIDVFKGVYNARVGYIAAMQSGDVETETTAYGKTTTDETDNTKKDVETTAYGKTTTAETDNTKKDVETTENDTTVYAEVGKVDSTRTREYKVTNTDDGEDTRTREYKVTHTDDGEDTRTISRAGDPSYFALILEKGTSDIFKMFTEKFINLFMGVL